MRQCILFFALLISACANPYAEFYRGIPDARVRSEYIPTTEALQIFRTDNIEQDTKALRRKGYVPVGSSSFNAASNKVTETQLREQANTIGAHVVLSTSKFTHTVSGTIPLTLPNTTTTFVDGKKRTTYGTQTTSIPYTVDRAEFKAVYFVKAKSRIGLVVAPLDDTTRGQLTQSSGVRVDVVVEGSPAFEADILPGDILLAFGGQAVRSVEHYQELLPHFTGKTVELVLNRDGRPITRVVAGQRLDLPPSPPPSQPISTVVAEPPLNLSPSPPPSPPPGSAARTALVIGNAAYPTQALSNPVHDAMDLANILRSLSFTVKVITNADKPMIERAVADFTTGVPGNTVGLFFFAGHGIQIDNSNYLLPIGAAFAAKSDVKFHAISADWVLARMEESGMAVKILLLDACRNDPFSRSWTRALDRGLAVMQAPEGAVIVYATAPGKTAEDGVGRNSPFTTVLLRELWQPKRPIVLTMQAVSEQVSTLTGKMGTPQTPYVTFAGRLGDFVFAP